MLQIADPGLAAVPTMADFPLANGHEKQRRTYNKRHAHFKNFLSDDMGGTGSATSLARILLKDDWYIDALHIQVAALLSVGTSKAVQPLSLTKKAKLCGFAKL